MSESYIAHKSLHPGYGRDRVEYRVYPPRGSSPYYRVAVPGMTGDQLGQYLTQMAESSEYGPGFSAATDPRDPNTQLVACEELGSVVTALNRLGARTRTITTRIVEFVSPADVKYGSYTTDA